VKTAGPLNCLHYGQTIYWLFKEALHHLGRSFLFHFFFLPSFLFFPSFYDCLNAKVTRVKEKQASKKEKLGASGLCL
jgi:hypothetical protein